MPSQSSTVTASSSSSTSLTHTTSVTQSTSASTTVIHSLSSSIIPSSLSTPPSSPSADLPLATSLSTSLSLPSLLPSGSSSAYLASPAKKLQPGAIGAIVICSILALAIGAGLLFWCRRRRIDQREKRFTRLRECISDTLVTLACSPPSICHRLSGTHAIVIPPKRSNDAR